MASLLQATRIVTKDATIIPAIPLVAFGSLTSNFKNISHLGANNTLEYQIAPKAK